VTVAKKDKPGKIPPPRKGGKTPPLKRDHVHNDNGRTEAKGGKLYTYCTCGHLMAVDSLES
jgi:hypothetical protein